MTEAEWMRDDDPLSVLFALYRSWPHPHHDKHRKLRLLACAWSRIDLVRAKEARWVAAVDAVEGFADGEITRAMMRHAVSHLPPDAMGVRLWASEGSSFDAAYFTLNRALPRQTELRTGVGALMSRLIEAFPGIWGPTPELAIRSHHMSLMRDIFGNPFCPVAFSPAWRTETAVALASGIYAERAFDRLPTLRTR